MKNGGQSDQVLMRSDRISPETVDTSIPISLKGPVPAARYERYPFLHPSILLPHVGGPHPTAGTSAGRLPRMAV